MADHELLISPDDVRTPRGEGGLATAGLVLVYQLRAFDFSKRVVPVHNRWRLGVATPRFLATVEEALRELFGMDV